MINFLSNYISWNMCGLQDDLSKSPDLCKNNKYYFNTQTYEIFNFMFKTLNLNQQFRVGHDK